MVFRARLIAPLALTGLTIVAAMSLARVFDSDEFVAPILLAAVMPHLVGALTRGRRWSLVWTLLVSFVSLLLLLTWITASETTWFGLPMLDTLREFGHQARAGWETIRGTSHRQIPVGDGPLFLAMVTTWLVAALADELAFRSRATLGASTPALVLLVFSSAIGARESQTEFAIAFGAAGALLLMVQSAAVLDRRRSWLATRAPARTGALTRSAIVVPVVLGVLALAAAPAISAALPGEDAKGLIGERDVTDTTSGGPEGTPFLDLSRTLKQGKALRVFSVRSPRPLYWRMDVLDRLEPGGSGAWVSADSGGGRRLPTQRASGVRQEFTIGAISGDELPAAYVPIAIDRDDVVISPSSTLRTTNGSIRGMRYVVISELPPTESEITTAQRAASSGQVPPELARFTRLPADVDATVASQARAVVQGANARTPYEQAKALRDFFRSPAFTYDLTVQPAVGADAIAEFLRTRRGYCQHFASAYAVMARSLGIPTRIAVGYTPGTFRNGKYDVTSDDAHAWPEVWLAGLGWVALFDPTPPSTGAGGSALPGEINPSVVIPATTVPVAATTAPPVSTAPPTTPAPTVARSEPADGSHGWLIPVVVALALLVPGLLYVGAILALKARHRARRRAVRDPSRAVGAAWASALEQLSEARVPVDAALTPLEVARRAPVRARSSIAAPLRRLARTYTAVRYGEHVPVAGDVEAAWSSVDELTRVLTDGLSTRERWRRRLDRGVLRRPPANR